MAPTPEADCRDRGKGLQRRQHANPPVPTLDSACHPAAPPSASCTPGCQPARLDRPTLRELAGGPRLWGRPLPSASARSPRRELFAKPLQHLGADSHCSSGRQRHDSRQAAIAAAARPSTRNAVRITSARCLRGGNVALAHCEALANASCPAKESRWLMRLCRKAPAHWQPCPDARQHD